MTGVPDGESVILSIEAAGFTVTKDGNELSKDNEGKYTYTGGNTTFRFTPTGVGVNTIRITGGDDNINVTTAEIEVTVTAAPVQGDVWEKTLNLSVENQSIVPTVEFTDEELGKFIVGKTLYIDIDFIQGSGWAKIVVMQRNKGWDGKLPSFLQESGNNDGAFVIPSEGRTISAVLGENDVEMIIQGKGLEFWGNGVMVTRIYIQ